MTLTWDQHLFFPTRVVTAHSQDQQMIDGLRHLFHAEKKYSDPKFNDVSDEENMLDQSERYPAMAQLKKFMWDGMMSWLREEGVKGDFFVQTHVFSNYGKKGAFVPVHNHDAHVSGVYYVDIPGKIEEEMFVQDRYWAQEHGVLLLHDPKFNASLAELTEKNYVKVFPRPGMGIIFPSYLWHSVTPHFEDQDRVSIAFNFKITSKEDHNLPREDLVL